MTILALVGVGVAAYLGFEKLTGGSPACGPLQGCETVAASSYSAVLGVPVALFGIGFSLLVAAASVAWWRAADVRLARRALVAAYGLGLIGTFVAAALTYLELFVIDAICVYCVIYGLTIVVGFAVAVLAARDASTA
jgi:uncharacterized membrane protein